MTDERVFFSAADAASYLGIGRSAFYAHFLTPRRLPTVRIGKRVLIHREDLEHLAAELREQAAEDATRHAKGTAEIFGALATWDRSVGRRETR